MKKEDKVEVFDVDDNTIQPVKEKKTKKTKNVVNLKETNITIKRVIVFFVTLLLVGGTIYGIITYTSYFKPIINIINPPKVAVDKLILNDIVYDLGQELKTDLTVYVVNNPGDKELLIDLSTISVDESNKTDKIGTYTYVVRRGEETFTGKITVVDKTPPVVMIKTAYIGLGEHLIKPEMFIKSATDNSKAYVAEIANLDTIRTDIMKDYPVKIIVRDVSGNFVELESKLVVLEEDFNNKFNVQDLNVSYNNKNDLQWKRTVTERFESAITNTSEYYKNAVQRIINYDWKTKVSTEYNGAKINSEDILILYNQHDLIIGLTKVVNITVDDEPKNFYLSY